MRGYGLVAAIWMVGGCGGGSSADLCASDDDCGGDGFCEPVGYCSQNDDTCPSGRRFEDGAGDGLGGECVDNGGTTTDDTTSADVSTVGVDVATTDDTVDPDPFCGNGSIDDGEECDDANGNEFDACTSECLLPRCDDGQHNGRESALDCGGGECPGCELCWNCNSDPDCESGVCGEDLLCTERYHVEIDWINDCSMDGFHVVEVEDLPAGSYVATAVPSAATKWAEIMPPAAGWMYRADCTGLVFAEMQTPPGVRYATPAEAFDNMIATTEVINWPGGILWCGLADVECADNNGEVIFDLEFNCVQE